MLHIWSEIVQPLGGVSMLANLIAGHWCQPHTPALPVYNPATEDVLDEVPLSGPAEVTQAVAAAAEAYAGWSQTPVMERVRLMFRFKKLLEEHFEELAAIVTRHHGKTLDEARGEVRRGIEVVDFACGAPTLLQGRTLRDVTPGVAQSFYRFPVGVVAGITPFNFPVMIPLWMFPMAIVCGNTFVLKPSEQDPMTPMVLAELALEAGVPPGVLNVVHGGKEAVDALCTHPEVKAVSFVGSCHVGEHVYKLSSNHGKRAQCMMGAKNHAVLMPDANKEQSLNALVGAGFGAAGQRCMAVSVGVLVGDANKWIPDIVQK